MMTMMMTMNVGSGDNDDVNNNDTFAHHKSSTRFPSLSLISKG